MSDRPPSSRLPPLPALEWSDEGAPYASEMDDIYYSKEDGLAEGEAVFLKGCRLPEFWAGKTRFTVGELGFGTGLNLLMLWKLWREHRPDKSARLDFVSFEGFPLSRTQAEKALAPWSALAPLRSILMENWPVRARGVQEISLPDGISLILHIDDIAKALSQSQFQADAWFLDGFSPAKNPAMWDDALYPEIARRSAIGAHLATFTVAGHVRRGLQSVGFTVSKRDGFGRKRHRLEAVFRPQNVSEPSLEPAKSNHEGRFEHPERDALSAPARSQPQPLKIAIIGGGIAGAGAAHALNRRGAKVTLYDKADHLGAGASGNRFALLMPRLDAADTGPARVLISAYLKAQSVYRGFAGAHSTNVEQIPRTPKEVKRYQALLQDPPLPEAWLSAGSEGSLCHHNCLILEPERLIADIMKAGATRTVLGKKPEIDLLIRSVNGEGYDHIILAQGMGVKALPGCTWLPLEARMGQVETGQGEDKLPLAVSAGHYALALGKDRLWGASFEKVAPTHNAQISPQARAANWKNLADLVSSDWINPAAPIQSRAGIRATTPDKLPLAGPLPDYSKSLITHADLRYGRAVQADMPIYAGLWLLTGLGARGFTFAPWLGEILARQIYGEAASIGSDEARLIRPDRFILRGLKRREI